MRKAWSGSCWIPKRPRTRWSPCHQPLNRGLSWRPLPAGPEGIGIVLRSIVRRELYCHGCAMGVLPWQSFLSMGSRGRPTALRRAGPVILQKESPPVLEPRDAQPHWSTMALSQAAFKVRRKCNKSPSPPAIHRSPRRRIVQLLRMSARAENGRACLFPLSSAPFGLRMRHCDAGLHVAQRPCRRSPGTQRAALRSDDAAA
jgi:hypothetical protein